MEAAWRNGHGDAQHQELPGRSLRTASEARRARAPLPRPASHSLPGRVGEQTKAAVDSRASRLGQGALERYRPRRACAGGARFLGLLSDLGGGPVALDSSIFIYFIEEHPIYLPVVEPLFEAIDAGELEAVTSSLTLIEARDCVPVCECGPHRPL